MFAQAFARQVVFNMAGLTTRCYFESTCLMAC